jgi:hypothetical protein
VKKAKAPKKAPILLCLANYTLQTYRAKRVLLKTPTSNSFRTPTTFETSRLPSQHRERRSDGQQ